MKFGLRIPSLKRRISARTSWKRYVRHNMGLKMPRGMGWLSNPRKALYNRVYNRTSFSIDRLFKVGKGRKSSSSGCGCLIVILLFLWIISQGGR